VGEFVPGYEATGWQGVGAPKNTPTEIIDKLNKGINAGLADPTLKARIVDLGVSLRHRPQDAYLSLSQRLSSVGSFL
jgi:tripartite-type tricarboxylate transporter receptor subunit TctC